MQKNILNRGTTIVLLVAALLMLAAPVSAQSGKILVDLTHAERVSIDGITSPNLDTSANGRIFNWTDWATYIRDEGYMVDALTTGPITSGTLEDYNVLIIAEPDVTASGPAYFITDECGVIKTFVENGGGLLLMGSQLVGGSSVSEFTADYNTIYRYPEIHNALLSNMSVGMSFSEGVIGTDPHDVMVDETDGIGGPKGNIWMHTGDTTHPIWDGVPDGRFAYWHGCSINVTDEDIIKVATGDDDAYTSVKNTGYAPEVKPAGSYPVAIAAAEYGRGKIVAYGDAGCWQGKTPFGSSVINNPDYHEQEVASNIMAYLCSKRILVDLTHAERVSIDGITSPNLDTSNNSRILNWTNWATYVRGEGYTVDALTTGPITSETLESCNVLIIPEPDVTTSGPAYFTTGECDAIETFVGDGGGLLLMGSQYIGGKSLSEYVADYDTVYCCPQIHNALLSNLGVGMSFCEGMIGDDPYDVIVNESAPIGGPKGNIWICDGNKAHPIWDGVPDGKFAYWHGCSINVTDGNIVNVSTGGDDAYTCVKDDTYAPRVKDVGSNPVAIAAAEYGNGKIVAYGDACCWHGTSPFGDVFTNPDNHAQEIASNIMTYLCGLLDVTAPHIVTYTISDRMISPNGDGAFETTEIDVEFSETVRATIKIENVSGAVRILYDDASIKNPDPVIWDGRDDGGNIVPDGTYYVNVTGTNITTGLSVVDSTETVVVDSFIPAPNTTTGINGNFTFTKLPAGDYTITALSPSGTEIGDVSITIEADQHLDVEMRLNGSADDETSSAIRNATVVNFKGPYGTGSISGRVLDTDAQPVSVSSAFVIITGYAGEGSLGSVNKDPKIIFLLLSEGDIFLTRQAVEQVGLNISVHTHYRLPSDLDLTGYDLIFVDRMVTDSIREMVVPMLKEAMENNATVIALSFPEYGNIPSTDPEYSRIMEYWSSRSIENMKRLIMHLGVEFCGLDGVVEDPIIAPSDGIYHPDADKIFEDLTEYLAWYGSDTGEHHVYNPDNYTVGVTFWQERYLTGESAIEDKVIRTLEERGINVIPVYQPMVLYPPLYPPGSGCENTSTFFMNDGEPAVDAIIDLGFGVYVIISQVKDTSCMEMLDVPIINGVELDTTIEEWENSTTGKGYYFQYHIPIMEIAAEIESIVVGGMEYNSTYDAYLLQPIDSQVDWIVNRTRSWIDLRYENNSDKNVAIIYYHHSVGKQNCLVAANLDVAPSIVNLLHAMNESGYALGDDIPDDKELLDLVLTQGRNIGIWVQDEINYVAENYDVALVSKEEYLNWFYALPEKKQNEVTERWGPPPGDIMVYKNDSGEFLVIPKITLGNTIVAPQPTRAKEQNATALYHDKSIPPTHQYIAFYFWLTKVYGADAIVSVGRHGTQEWLPGKGVGLSVDDCWPAILIQDMPVVYHYEVEGIGEGIMAKRRGNAVMIDHLTPVIVASGLYGNLSNLEQTIPQYENYDPVEDAALKNATKDHIIELCRDLNLEQDPYFDVNLTEMAAANETVFEEFLEELHDYLLMIKQEYMPYGLHIMGKQLSNDSIVDMTKSLLGYKFKDYATKMNLSENDTRALLYEAIFNATDEGGTAENMTVLARTISDSGGNYTFTNISAGNYTITSILLGPPGWTMKNVDVSIDTEHTDLDIWLEMSDEESVRDVANAIADPTNLTGNYSISGTVLAETPFGNFKCTDATVVIAEKKEKEVDELANYLTLARLYAENLRECTIEINRTLDALDGRYIIPGPSNDPIRNPDVLPTGRNFYGFDPNIVPTKPSWVVGKEVIDQLLAPYEENGTYPKKVGFVMFSFNTMKDMGVLESEIFYLLGVEPVWDTSYGTVKYLKLIPSEELGRPRIDVVITMSGIYRENWPHQIELINDAVRMASEAENDTYPNYVNESTESTYQWLRNNTNYTESYARKLSLIRIFGPPEGVWGVGGLIPAIASSGSWDNESTIADLYLRNMGYAYGSGIWGEQYVDLFSQNLNGTEIAIFAWSSHSHSIIGIDHTFEFFGGLSMAIREITGEAPDMYINNLRDPDGAKLETLDQTLARELRSMYYNPLFIRGLMEHGYAGARELDKFFENIWGWEVTCPDAITNEMWNEMYNIYIQDDYGLGLKDFFDENNPHALQSMTARMLEAIRHGYWNPSDEIKAALAREYHESVEDYGVACCGHTCGNPFIDKYVSGVLSVPGADIPEQSSGSDSPDGNREGTYPPTPSAPQSTTNETQAEDISVIPGGVKDIPVITEPDDVVGQVIEKTEMKTDITFSGMEILGLVVVFLVLGLIYAGFRRKR